MEKRMEKLREKRKRIPVKSHKEIAYSTHEGRVAGMYDSQREMFDHIWDTRDHVSFLSGLPIHIEPHSDLWWNCFSHLLSKALNKYPKYKLFEHNVILLTHQEHYLLDFGTVDQRIKYCEEHGCNWNKLYTLAEELKSQYPNT